MIHRYARETHRIVTMSDKKAELSIFWYHHKIAQKLQYVQDLKLSEWVRSFGGFLRDCEKSDKSNFTMQYLNSTVELCLGFLPLNLLLLLASIAIIAQHRLGFVSEASTDTFRNMQPAIVGIFIWMVLSTLCLIFLVAFRCAPDLIEWIKIGTIREVWYEIGGAVLLTRIIILVAQLARMMQSSGQCLDQSDLLGTGEETFGYMFIQTTIDTYQTYVLTMLPFPQPWALILILVELIRQLVRVTSCANRISTDPDLRWIVSLAVTMLVYTYIFLLAVPSIYREGSFRNRFRSEQLQREADQSKREMVGFLSRDVRVPLQYMLHALASIDLVAIAGSNVQPLLNDIHRYSGIVNAVADELLLVVRIKEGRYTSRLTPVPDLWLVLDEAIEGFKQRRFPRGRRGELRQAGGAPELIVDIAAHVVPLEVDEKAMLAALRHLLVFLVQPAPAAPLQSQRSVSASSGENTIISPMAQQEPTRIALNIKADLLRSAEVADARHRASGSLALTVTSGASAPQSPLKSDEANTVREATTCYVCATIAAACGGTFSSKKGGIYVLTVPCKYAAEGTREAQPENISDPDGVESIGAGSAPSHARSAGADRDAKDTLQLELEELEQKVQMSADTREAVRRNKVCAIVADPVLESVITRAIERMGLGVGMTVLHELPAGNHVPVALLTFTTSFETCLGLRRRGYRGRSVLFSGSSSYMDDAEVAQVDYCLPLPCSDHEMGKFLDWLVLEHEDDRASSVEERASVFRSEDDPVREDGSRAGSLRARRRSEVHPRTVQSTQSEKTVAGLAVIALLGGRTAAMGVRSAVGTAAAAIASGLRFCRDCIIGEHTWFFVPRLSSGIVETYSKWRLLNPSGSWYHHSTEIFMLFFPRIIVALLVETLLLPALLRGATVPLVITSSVLILRGVAYKYVLKPLGIPLWLYWTLPPLVGAAVYINSILQFSYTVPEQGLSMSAYEATMYGESTGAQHLYSQMTVNVSQRIFAMYFLPPINLVIILLTFLNATLSLWDATIAVAPTAFAQFTQLVYVQLTTLNVAYLTHLEHTYRREFKATYEHTLARAFLEQCLEICQQDIRRPLEFLLGRKDDIMQVLYRAALSRDFIIDVSLMESLEPLHLSHLLLAELEKEFSYSQLLAPVDVGAPPVRQPVDAVQLSRKVAEMIGAFSSCSPEQNVSIEAEVDVALTVVKVDWAMLSTILTNLISASLRALREDCIESPRKVGLKNEVFIKIVAVPDGEGIIPFVAPRLMLINVCDNSTRGVRLRNTGIKSKEDGTVEAAGVPEGAGSQSSERGNMFQYGRAICEKLVHKVVEERPLFQTIYSADSRLQTVQRFAFPYQLSSQTRRAEEYLKEETKVPYISIRAEPAHYLAAYKRILNPNGRAQRNQNGIISREPGKKNVVMVSCVDPQARGETMKAVARLQEQGWSCTLKYVVRMPTLRSIGAVDCVLIDQQLQIQEGVSICEVVLKLRASGFSGVIAVVLTDGSRSTNIIKEDLEESAAKADVILYAPLSDENIRKLTSTMEKKCVKQVLSVSGV